MLSELEKDGSVSNSASIGAAQSCTLGVELAVEVLRCSQCPQYVASRVSVQRSDKTARACASM